MIWHLTEHGYWCPSCGDRIAKAPLTISELDLPGECCTCGFPDHDKMAQFHCDDEIEYDEEESYFDCGMLPDGTCQLAGTEECDWECPHS